MKKLIVLSVIFALVAGSVFAADVGVDVHGQAKLIKTSSHEYLDDVKDDETPVYVTDRNGTDFGISRVRLSASGATEDGTVGGWLRYELGGGGAGFVYWKPAEIFKLQIGQNPDGEFGLDGGARWGFYQIAGDVGVASEGWAFGDSFFGGYGGSGIILTSSPIEALTINLGIPLKGTTYGSDSDDLGNPQLYKFGENYAYQNYKQFTLQVKYAIDGVGTAGITYQNSLFIHDQGEKEVFADASGAPLGSGAPHVDADGDGKADTVKVKTGAPNNDNPYLWAYFGLTSIENLGIDVGIGYKFSDTWYVNGVSETGGKKNGTESTVTINNPLSVGVAANFTSGALGVKARLQGKFLGSVVQDLTTYSNGDKVEAGTYSHTLGTGLDMIIDVQPSYAINETLTAYVSLGVGFLTGDEEPDPEAKEWTAKANTRSLVNWHVNPYIVITPSYWSGAFFATIRLLLMERKGCKITFIYYAEELWEI